jgi:hypothetical protein
LISTLCPYFGMNTPKTFEITEKTSCIALQACAIMACVEHDKDYCETSAERLEIQKRRCTACQENVKSVVRDRYPETWYLTQ